LREVDESKLDSDAREALNSFQEAIERREPRMIGKESNATINHQPLPVMPIKIDFHTYFASSPQG
jgi:hypothetical protein